MNISIPSIKTKVKEEYLYDMDLTKDKLIPCTIVGVSAYKNCTLTFHAVIDNKYLYSDLPITAFTIGKVIYDLKTLAYFNCPSNIIEMFKIDSFIDKEISCFFKNINKWEDGEYLFSIDFTNDNELLHFIKLDIGSFALVPNHKINWDKQHQLSDYKKNHFKHTI